MSDENPGAAALRRAVWASTIGNAVEWFDFTIFALFAAAIGAQFFPKSDPFAGLLAAYGVFAVAYVARPLGGLWFGLLADKFGRKSALIAVILLMGLGTAAIAVLPTYEQVGVIAPLALVCARLVQGFSAGGDFGASTALLLEFAPSNRRGFYASFQFVSQAIAFLIGSAFAAALTASMPSEALRDWGWRLPFLAGLVIAPLGLYLRRRVDETPEFCAFVAERQGLSHHPLKMALAEHGRAILALILVTAGFAAFTAIGLAFVPNFATRDLGLRLVDAQFGLVAVNLAAIFVMPFAARLSDRFGRVAMMAPAMILYLIVAFFAMRSLIDSPSRAALWTLQLTGLLIAFAMGPYCALATEVFPLKVRSTSASIAYNVAVAVFGGTAPLAAGWLTQATHDKAAPFYYLFGCILISLLGLSMLPRGAPQRRSGNARDVPTANPNPLARSDLSVDENVRTG